MCEPDVIHGGGPGRCAGTHLSVTEHQARTVANFCELCELWLAYSGEQCPFMPVLQGWAEGDYWRCAELYDSAGVRLKDYPVVGLGSVCRRQGTPAITLLIGELTPWIAVHGFGMKRLALPLPGTASPPQTRWPGPPAAAAARSACPATPTAPAPTACPAPPNGGNGYSPTSKPPTPAGGRKTCSPGRPRDGRRVPAVARGRPSSVAPPR